MLRVFVFVLSMLSMSSALGNSEESAGAPSALALNLAKHVVASESLDPRIKSEFDDRIAKESRHYKKLVEQKLQGEKLSGALNAIERFDAEMSAQANDIVSNDSLVERLGVYYDENFTRKEIKTLLKVFKKDVWKKYQEKMNYLDLDPDKILGFREDFEKRLEKARVEIIAKSLQ